MKYDPENLMERTKTKDLPLANLKLDPGNIRLKHLKKDLSQKDIEDYFWNQKQTHELMAQIRAAKGLYQPPIVTSGGIVKEGNRRLVCLRKLHEKAHAGELPEVSKTHYDNIKCQILPFDASDEEISLLLATIHVRGKKSWDGFNKADMLAHLNKDLHISYDVISKDLGMSKPYLIRLIKAHEVTLQYGERYPDDANWYEHFLIFEELFKRRDLKDWRDDNPDNMTRFFSWVHDGKLVNHKYVRQLKKILENAAANRIMDEKGFEDAIKYLNSFDPTIGDSNFRKISHTINILRSLDRKAIIEIINDSARLMMLQTLSNEVTSLLNDLKALNDAKKQQEGENLE